MPSYKLQVKVLDRTEYVWKDCHPSHTEEPYRFKTKEQALKVRRMNYPGEFAEFLRVVECDEAPNYGV